MDQVDCDPDYSVFHELPPLPAKDVSAYPYRRNAEITTLVRDTIEKTRKESKNEDLATKLDESEQAMEEAQALSATLSNRILNVKKDDYTPGNYPKFYDLGNKVAAIHAMTDSL